MKFLTIIAKNVYFYFNRSYFFFGYFFCGKIEKLCI